MQDELVGAVAHGALVVAGLEPEFFARVVGGKIVFRGPIGELDAAGAEVFGAGEEVHVGVGGRKRAAVSGGGQN